MTTNLWMPVGPFGFDGFGVNDYGKDHHPRVATLTQDYRNCRGVGDLLAAAPDLLAALEAAYNWIDAAEQHFVNHVKGGKVIQSDLGAGTLSDLDATINAVLRMCKARGV